MNKRRDTHSVIRIDDLLATKPWAVIYTDFDGSEITVAKDLSLATARRLVKERNWVARKTQAPNSIMKHLAF